MLIVSKNVWQQSSFLCTEKEKLECQHSKKDGRQH